MAGEWRRVAGYAAAVIVGAGALAGTVARMTVFVPMAASASTVEARLGGGRLDSVAAVVLVVALVGVFTVVPLCAVVSERLAKRDAAWLAALCVGGIVVFAVGFVAVQPIAAGFSDVHTERYGGFAGPHAKFAADERLTEDGERVLRITHEGGDRLAAANVRNDGEGFVNVETADQMAAGPWRGAASGERPRRGGSAIVMGDAVEVGVAGDCEVRVVYAQGDESSTLFYHECGDD